ncbi:MAG TPA: carboxypeptidase regulatory-like domain-containing protein [Pyrinomonadaceae bacterium]|nr:carboxypeptidase regulatory-like domain-containing protein [Pyrinomonadaceae bacterium]
MSKRENARSGICHFLVVITALIFSASPALAQSSAGTLRGQVQDTLGGLVVGVTVTATDAAGVSRTATTDGEGKYTFPGLPPGRYTVRVEQPGFEVFEQAVEVVAGVSEPLNITINVGLEAEEVTVTAETPISTEPESDAGAVVIRGAALDALPDDEEDLADALQALAGPSAGPEGEGEIYTDGFSGGRLPPKESIREIRINRNPFSAEYERLGYGRIEIFTKPGTNKMRGQAYFNFGDESLNARNPFARVRAPYQSRRYGGNLSGPIIQGKTSFFFDFQRSETDENNVINAVVLDAALNPIAFNQTVQTPVRRTTFSPRLDWQLNANNTVVARYTYERSKRANQGVGDFNLPERAYDTSGTQHTIQLTETAVISQKVINETRFQFERDRSIREGGLLATTIRVQDAFTGGGAQVGLASTEEDRFELQNFTSWSMGPHALKAGARVRHVKLRDVSQSNFAGTFTFAGTQIVVPDPTSPTGTRTETFSSLEQYRQTLLGTPGFAPSQFSLSAGNPEVSISRTDFSPFIQDDWRVRPNLTISAGLRYDWQTNIKSSFNFAPRLAFAWSPDGGARQQKTVLRGGFGVFYNTLNESLLLQTDRFNGVNQQQFLVTSASPGAVAILGGFPVAPTLAQLAAFSVPQTIRRLAPDLLTPYTLQSALSVERQLPNRSTLSINFVNARTLHVLRSRNINAPVPGTGLRPFPGQGNIFQYESSGRFNQQQLIVNLNNRLSPRFTLSANYVFNRARSDTDGAGTFPANQYDLSGEYGRSSQDIRHRFSVFGNISGLPWGIRLSPIVIANSGRPFNITVGRDLNGDTLFNDRPAFATDTADSGFRPTTYGLFDVTPSAGQQIIPRNYATGPSFFVVNLRASKSLGFGEPIAAAAGPAGGAGGRGGGRRGGGGGRGGGGRGGGDGEGDGRYRYNLNFSVSVQNLLNNVNEGVPVGNLSSTLFGQSISSAGGFGRGGGGGSAANRRIDLQLRFSF